MLPMRCALPIMLFVFASIGCRNQSMPLTNPFLTPDRVPPPSTRVLAPGAAQPYYSGDQLPGAAASPPATSFGAPQVLPPSSAPAGVFPSGPMTPGTPITPTSPPTNWSGSPTAQLSPTPGDAVSVPNDQNPLRFASASAPTLAASLPVAAATPPHVNPTPLDSGGARAFTPNAGAQLPVQSAGYDAPLPGAAPFSTVKIREVTPAEDLSPRPAEAAAGTSGAGAATAASDGFRPQGTTPPREAEPSPSFRTPEIHRDGLEAESSDARYGVGETQDWLRGQLEYWPETGQWSIRYMDP